MAEYFSLLSSLQGERIKLLIAAMREVGPASQTLGGFLAITNSATFVANARVAGAARLPLSTTRKHLAALQKSGWVANEGRGRTDSGRPRRTCTLRLTKKTAAAIGQYGVLPWWACVSAKHPVTGKVGRLSWASRAVLSLVMAQLAKLNATAERQEMELDEFEDARWKFTLAEIAGRTGLSRHSIISAKRALERAGIVKILESDEPSNGGPPASLLVPSRSFRVAVSPAGTGRVRVEFLKGG